MGRIEKLVAWQRAKGQLKNQSVLGRIRTHELRNSGWMLYPLCHRNAWGAVELLSGKRTRRVQPVVLYAFVRLVICTYGYLLITFSTVGVTKKMLNFPM